MQNKAVAKRSASLLAAMLGLSSIAMGPLVRAQASDANTLVIPRGGEITLPLSGITRVVAADDDVARGYFDNGKVLLQGVSVGQTRVEVYQGDSHRSIYTVQVRNTAADSKELALLSQASLNLPAASEQATSNPAAGDAGARGSSITPVLPPAAQLSTVALGSQATTTLDSAHNSPLSVSLRVTPAEDNPTQALFTISYGNHGASTEQGVLLRYALDDPISYVTGSATGNMHYDAAARELVWNVGTVLAGSTGNSVSFRVEPIERKTVTFSSQATIEDSSGRSIPSNAIKYSTSPTPLLTVFALPDRFLAGRNAPVLVDVRGIEFQTAVDRLQKMGIISGRQPGLFYPDQATKRAEYAVMTLNGLNLRDLRDLTAIKFVLGRRSTVSLNIVNSQGQLVATLIKSMVFEPGERTAIWDGRSGTGYAAPGRYTYVCTARDSRGETTVLRGRLTIVPQTPVIPVGVPDFSDVSKTDWYAGYLAIAQKQDLIRGYPDRKFLPEQAISRVEATTIVVRALGLEDLARRAQNTDAGFLDYQDIPPWAVGYVNVASALGHSTNGKLIVGYPGNTFLPLKALRRDEAALIVQRLVDKEVDRRVPISGQIAPGATVTIGNRTVQAADDGNFEFVLDQTSEPITVAVVDTRR